MKNLDIKEPKLRFPEFTDPLNRRKLGEITKWSSGGTPPKDNPQYWGGGIPWISAASMHGRIFSSSTRTLTAAGVIRGSKIAKKGSVLLLVRGSMLFKTIPVGIAGLDVSFNQDVKCITGKSIDEDYLYHWLKSNEHYLLSMVVGTGIGAGKLETLKLQAMRVFFPSPAEQKKIADFMGGIDERIDLARKKIAQIQVYKKQIMTNVFTQKVRFKDVNSKAYPDWRESCLGDILQESTERTTGTGEYELLSSTSKGLFKQTDYFKKEVASNNTSGYKILRLNQIVFSPQNLWMGNINLNLTFNVGIVSPSYKVFSLKDINAQFVGHILRSPKMIHEYKQASEQGASVVRRNLDTNSFMAIKIDVPCKEEQQKIVNLLNAINDRIKIEESKLHQMVAAREYFLHHLFI